jgi:hypothetical protein
MTIDYLSVLLNFNAFRMFFVKVNLTAKDRFY